MQVGVAGASGYAGAELLRLLAGHEAFELSVAMGQRHEGTAVAEHTPSLAAAYPGLIYEATSAEGLDGLDLVFLALPHGASQAIVPDLIGRVGTIVDLGADFRLDPATYELWYGDVHTSPELCRSFVYGLVERARPSLSGATMIASPGCYPTAATLALAPFADADLIDLSDVIVDAASGVSGAGRASTDRLHFAAVDESYSAYGLLDHRHTAEMEQNLGATVLFTPHLAPMVRGMLVTAHARPTASLSTAEAIELLHLAYDDEPFVHVVTEPPSTKQASGSNSAFVTARVDIRTGRLLVLCAIDNLGKGAAGQAIQAANVAVGLNEGMGLSAVGLYP